MITRAKIDLQFNHANAAYLQFSISIGGMFGGAWFHYGNDILNSKHLLAAARFCKSNDVELEVTDAATGHMSSLPDFA